MAAGTAQADTVTIDIGGALSNAEFGDASNETRFVDLFSNVHITNVSWNVNLSTFGSSWLSEMGFDLSNDSGSGASLFPGLGDDSAGSGSYSGSADLVSLGADFFLGADGRLNLQFFEYFDDLIGAADGIWNRGSSLTVTYVPEPATFGLAAIALLGMGLSSRRKKS
ncbi:PEP-CTERM sorting domain-containing protein [Roseateles violae]|uniref:PEP-CTERM sorting domain-containing protein n=1 Tax=Roseateles violae TaxID=3058042 RepID=A0ABT8DP80_9BURK|nr:PEP-CTERM sorting domain-containing protein [Pelomonas sp. PFR6]MDN3918855.1 PEP-CTERM sorting domain-containing protein [Pelomonas sp. PFR6]